MHPANMNPLLHWEKRGVPFLDPLGGLGRGCYTNLKGGLQGGGLRGTLRGLKVLEEGIRCSLPVRYVDHTPKM